MKTLKILIALCIMLGFSETANSQDKGKQVVRPMKCRFYANVVATNGAVETLSITGNATHIGKFTGTMYFDKTTIGFNPTAHGIEITGVKISGTIVAANGDEIEFGPDDPGMVITGQGPSGIMSGEVVLNPGTGRFTNCSGTIITTGIFDMGNDYAKWTAVGWIKY
jgi:hypothetical protein